VRLADNFLHSMAGRSILGWLIGAQAPQAVTAEIDPVRLVVGVNVDVVPRSREVLRMGRGVHRGVLVAELCPEDRRIDAPFDVTANTKMTVGPR
jgi:hypothetical protein